MSSTFLQLQNNIADYLDRTDLTTQIKAAINRAIFFYSSENFWFNETTDTLNTVADQESYGSADSLATDIRKIIRVEYTESSHDYEVISSTLQEVRRNNASSTSGIPVFYAWFNQKIYLSPIPNAANTVTIYYTQYPADLSLDADTNNFTTYAEDLIEARACSQLYAKVLQSKEKADEWKGLELEALRNLKQQNNNLLATRTVARRF